MRIIIETVHRDGITVMLLYQLIYLSVKKILSLKIYHKVYKITVNEYFLSVPNKNLARDAS